MKKREKKKSKINWEALTVSILVVGLIWCVGSQFTYTDSWYDTIKPNITPPGYVFSIVWSILFILIGLSLYLNLSKGTKQQRKGIKFIFGANFLFNLLWSYIFFRMKNIQLAFFDILLVLVTIVYMIRISWRIDHKAGYLLIPYLLWVTFAAVLNYMILVGIRSF
jgi:benzodiazapine receptor